MLRKPIYVCITLECDTGLQDKYLVEATNIFQILDGKDDATARYERFMTAHAEATRKVLKLVPKRKTAKFSDERKAG